MTRTSNQPAETRCRESKRNFWNHHLDTWEISGQILVQYCQENQLNKHTFAYWKSNQDHISIQLENGFNGDILAKLIDLLEAR